MFAEEKVREFEKKKALKKAPTGPCVICGDAAAFDCPCETVQYCSRKCLAYRGAKGHWIVCRGMRDEQRAAVATADWVKSLTGLDDTRAKPEPLSTASTRDQSGCAICSQKWDANADEVQDELQFCCARKICTLCAAKYRRKACPLCWAPYPKNHKEMVRLLHRHAMNSQPVAISYLADTYRTGGLGLEKNVKQAVKFYHEASELGFAYASGVLARMYDSGEDGVRIDKDKSMELSRIAADQGYVQAQYHMANELRDTANYEESLVYCRLAAEQGHTLAQRNLGGHYLSGMKGVDRDADEARRWFARAAAKGEEASRKLVAEIDAARALAGGGSDFAHIISRRLADLKLPR